MTWARVRARTALYHLPGLLTYSGSSPALQVASSVSLQTRPHLCSSGMAPLLPVQAWARCLWLSSSSSWVAQAPSTSALPAGYPAACCCWALVSQRQKPQFLLGGHLLCAVVTGAKRCCCCLLSGVVLNLTVLLHHVSLLAAATLSRDENAMQHRLQKVISSYSFSSATLNQLDEDQFNDSPWQEQDAEEQQQELQQQEEQEEQLRLQPNSNGSTSAQPQQQQRVKRRQS